MEDEHEKDDPQVQADDNSIAIGGITIGGDLSGAITIGHGYTAEQVSVLLTQITSTFQPKPFDGRCPYKGLDVFEEEDAELFFGRERLVEDLVNRVKESRTVFITGPSGSGKSSLVRAGLIHALKNGAIKNSERWLYETMKPGREPIKDLALAFSRLKSPELSNYFLAHKNESNILNECAESVLSGRKDQRFVLFIDQFEETFTQINGEEERIAFINMLAHAGTVENGRVIVLFAMRSDFVSNCATYPSLNEMLSQEFRQIGAMQPEELVSAIALPARHVGLPIEDELIARIINDMKGEPGALPLMQFALKDLFDSQQEKGGVIALTLEDYLKHGGIHKSLERHADASLAKLNHSEQELARNIFSGLIEIGRGTQDTKRTALFDELVPANTKPEEVGNIVQKLADARLIITDEQAGKDTVTISHEKLIEAWPWLKRLVNENRGVIALQNEIASDAKEWEEHGQDTSYLYRGSRLESAREKIASKMIILSELALLFIETGTKEYSNELEVVKKRATQLQRQARNLAVALVFTLITVTVAIYFGVQSRQQARISLAHQMAAQSQTINATRNSRQMQAVLLALHSMQISPSSEAAQVLLSNLAASPIARTTHNELVVSVAFSPDGKFVVSGSWNGTAQVWEAATGKIISRMLVESNSSWSDHFSAVSFSPDGKYVVSVSLCEGTDNIGNCLKSTTRVFDTLTGVEISHMTHNDEIRAVAFSPNGIYVATGSLDKTARVWDPATGKEINLFTHEHTVRAVVFSPDSNYLMTIDYDNAGSDKTVHIWDIETGKKISHIVNDTKVLSIAISPDGKYAVSGSWGGTARVWEMATGKEILKLTKDNSYAFNTVAFSPNGKYMLSSGDNKVILWDAATGKELSIMTHENEINSVAFSPDSKFVVSGSYDYTARVWDALTGKEISRMTHDNVVNSVAFSPDSKFVISGSDDGTARVWEVKNNGPITYSFPDDSNSVSPKYLFSNSNGNEWQEPALILDAEKTNKIYKVFGKYQDTVIWLYELSKNREYLVMIPDPGNIAHVWDIESTTEVATFHFNGRVSSATFSPDGKYLVLGSDEDSTAHLWEVKTGKEVFQLITHKDNSENSGIQSLDYSQDGKYIVSATIDVAKVWDAVTGHEIASMTPPSYFGSGIVGVAFSPDGKYVLGKDLMTDVMIWEVKTGTEITHISIESNIWGSASSLVFSPDSKFFVLGTPIDKTARVYNLITGEEISRMTHDDEVISVALSPNSEYIVSTSNDGAARVWGMKTGKEIIRFPIDSNDTDVAFSSDSNSLLTGSLFGTTHVWQWQPEYLIGKVCITLPRGLTPVEWKQYVGDALPYQAVCPDYRMIAWEVLSNSNKPNRVKNALDKVKTELAVVGFIEDPTTEALEIVRLATEEQISTEVYTQNIESALDLLNQAKESQVPISIYDADTLNNLCWFGSLQRYAEQVMDYCEQAVTLAPGQGYIRDSRGLARALTGDYPGAILDFQYYVDEQIRIGNGQSFDVSDRQQWIMALKTGINPFTPDVLQRLASNGIAFSPAISKAIKKVVIVNSINDYYKYITLWSIVLYTISGLLAYRAISSRVESPSTIFILKNILIAGSYGGVLVALISIGLLIPTIIISENYIIADSPSPFVLLLLLPAGFWAGGVYGHFTRYQLSKLRQVVLGGVAGIIGGMLAAIILLLTLYTLTGGLISFTSDDLLGFLEVLGIMGGIGGVLSAVSSLVYIFGVQKWSTKSAATNKYL
jgi:WD40 repeat protein